MDQRLFEARVGELLVKTDDRLTPELVAYRVGCSPAEAEAGLVALYQQHRLVALQDERGVWYFDATGRQPGTGAALSWMSPPPATGARPARPRAHPLAVVAGVGGIVVALGYLFVGGMFLLDALRVTGSVGITRASSAITMVLLIGLVVAAVAVYVGYRAARGGVTSMFLLAILHLGFWFAASNMLTEQPRSGDPLGALVVAQVQARLQGLSPLGTASIVVVLLAIAAAVVTLTQRRAHPLTRAR